MQVAQVAYPFLSPLVYVYSLSSCPSALLNSTAEHLH